MIVQIVHLLVGCSVEETSDDTLILVEEEQENEEVILKRPLRHMTLRQYNNTIRNLFEPYDVPTSFWLELELDGLYDRDSDIFQASPVLVESLQQSSLSVVELLLDQGYCDRCSDVSCAQDFIVQEGSRIWRRPMTEEEIVQIQSDIALWIEQTSLSVGIAMGLQYLLQSPHFFYFPETPVGQPLTDWQIASRMSYFLWNSMPDQELFDLAQRGQLQDGTIVEQQAWRMLDDERAVNGWLDFHRQWLELDRINSQVIDLSLVSFFPFDELNAEHIHHRLQPQMRQQVDLFLLENILYGEGTVSELLTSTNYFISEHLANLYGVTLPTDQEGIAYTSIIDESQTEALETPTPYTQVYYPVDVGFLGQRIGLTTHAGWLHANSTIQHPSVVQRGLSVMEQLLCQSVDAPPNDASLTSSEEEPLTNRERYAQHSSDPSCSGCHIPIDGIGFTFEHYDIMGRYQLEDNGYPIDASGQLIGTDVDGDVSNALDLMTLLSDSRQVHDCITSNWMEYAMAYQVSTERNDLVRIQEQFWEEGGYLPSLLVSIVTSPTFLSKEQP